MFLESTLVVNDEILNVVHQDVLVDPVDVPKGLVNP